MMIIGNFITEELIFGNRLSSTKIMMISDLSPNKEPTKFPSKSDALKRLVGQLYGIILPFSGSLKFSFLFINYL